jgi:hypothetical protein
MAYDKIKPIADVGENLLLIDNANYELYQVAYRNAIPQSHPFVVDASAGLGLVAGGRIQAFNTNNILDLNEGQVAQFRAFVLDDVHVRINQPAATARQALGQLVATFNPFSKLYDPDDALTEFFSFEDVRPILDITNPSGYALVQVRVAFYGYRYILAGKEGTSALGGRITPIDTFRTIKAARESSYKFAAVAIGGWPK